MLTKLEEIKQNGSYAIQLWFGEDIGCDDSSVPVTDRKIVVMWNPVGHLGEIQSMFKGDVSSFLDFDIKSNPTILSNPPKKEKYEKAGYYMWGTERSISSLLTKKK